MESNSTSVDVMGQTNNEHKVVGRRRGNRGGRGRGNRGGRGRTAGDVKVDVSKFPTDTVAYTIRHASNENGSFAGTGGVVPMGQVDHLVVSRSAGPKVHLRAYRTLVMKRPDEAIIGVHPLSNRLCVRLDNTALRSRGLAQQAQALTRYVQQQIAHDTSTPQALRDVSEMQLPVVRAVFAAAEMQTPIDSAALHGYVAQARRRGMSRFVPWNIVAESAGLVVECEPIGDVRAPGQTPWVRLRYVPGARERYGIQDWLSAEEDARPDTVDMLLPFVQGRTPDVGQYVEEGTELTALREVDVQSAQFVIWQAFLSPMPWGLDVPTAHAVDTPAAHTAGGSEDVAASYESYDACDLVGVPLPFAAPLLRRIAEATANGGDMPSTRPLMLVEDVRHMLNETAPNPAADVLQHGFGPELTDWDRRYVTLTVGVNTPVARIAVDHMRKAVGALAVYATDDDLRAGLLNPQAPLTLSGLGRTYVADMKGMDSLKARGLGVAVDFGTRDRRFTSHGPLIDTGVSVSGDAVGMSAAAARLRDGDRVVDVLGDVDVMSVADAVTALAGMGG